MPYKFHKFDNLAHSVNWWNSDVTSDNEPNKLYALSADILYGNKYEKL